MKMHRKWHFEDERGMNSEVSNLHLVHGCSALGQVDPASLGGRVLGQFDPASLGGRVWGQVDPASLGGRVLGQFDPASLGGRVLGQVGPTSLGGGAVTCYISLRLSLGNHKGLTSLVTCTDIHDMSESVCLSVCLSV